MKRKLKYIFKIIPTIVLLAIISLIGFYAIRLMELGFFNDYQNIQIAELTGHQKTDEFTYLVNFVNAHSPYVDVIHTEKGLKNIHSVENYFIQKATNSKNNKEYLEVILDYLMILQQTGHAGLFEIKDKPKSNFDYWFVGLGYNLPAECFYYQQYWTKISEEIHSQKKWYYSDLDIIYDGGYYKVRKKYFVNGINIPEGSIIKKIDNVQVDSFVYSQWSTYILRFDTRRKKNFCCVPDPLISNNDTSQSAWKIDFKAPSNNLIVDIPKLSGFKQTRIIPDFNGNVKCVRLTQDAAYIKIKQFLGYPAYLKDFNIIDSFLNNSKGHIKKLIIDVRNNRGGAPGYWQRMFVERFIKDKQQYVQYAAIKKNAYELLNIKPFFYSYFTGRDLNFGESNKILLNDSPFDLKKYSFLNDEEWYYFQNTISFSPNDPFDFNGELFLLTDNDCFSATEDFARAVKQLKLMTVVGANTYGGGAVICEPWYFELPYSHMILRLEIQMAFNPDGSINSVYGTEPDIRLDKHQFPTSYPAGFNKEDLLKDDWINHIINLKSDKI